MCCKCYSPILTLKGNICDLEMAIGRLRIALLPVHLCCAMVPPGMARVFTSDNFVPIISNPLQGLACDVIFLFPQCVPNPSAFYLIYFHFYCRLLCSSSQLFVLYFIRPADVKNTSETDAISLRLQGKLSFPYNCQKMNGQIYVLLC